jgi:DNA-binding Lrp family transcriptional regulator
VITAIVLVETEVSKVPEVAAQIADLAGVSEVYSVTGDVDLVAVVRVREHEELSGVIADRLGKVPGVRSTKTYLAFRAYSKHDLEAAFALGIEEG